MLNKVLLIDDSVTIHRVIDLSIDLERLSLVKVFNKKDAEEKLQSDKFDYILLDNKLDDIQVNSFVKELKNKYPSTKLILLVGAFDKFTEQDLANTGADDFLVKPFDSETLNLKLSDTTEVTSDIPTPIYFSDDDTDEKDNIDNIDDVDDINLFDEEMMPQKDITDIDFSVVEDDFTTGTDDLDDILSLGNGDDIDLLDMKSDILDNVLEDDHLDIDIDLDVDSDFFGDIGTDDDLNGTDKTLDTNNTSYTNISDDAFKDIDLLLGDFDLGFSTDENNIDSDKGFDEVASSDEFISSEQSSTNIDSDDPVLDDIEMQLGNIDDLDIDTLSAISEIEKDINDIVVDSDEDINSNMPLETKDTDLDFTLDDIDISALHTESGTDIIDTDIEDMSALHTGSGTDIIDTDIEDISALHTESDTDIIDTDIEDISALHTESGTDIIDTDIEDMPVLHTESDTDIIDTDIEDMPALHTESDTDIIDTDIEDVDSKNSTTQLDECVADNLDKDNSSTLYDEVVVPTLNEYEKRFDSIQSRSSKKKSYNENILDVEEISFIDDKTQSDTSKDINFNISKDEIYSILANSLSKKFLQESIKDILSDHIKELVRDVIPTIAEKYIKEEIERLKSDV